MWEYHGRDYVLFAHVFTELSFIDLTHLVPGVKSYQSSRIDDTLFEQLGRYSSCPLDKWIFHTLNLACGSLLRYSRSADRPVPTLLQS